MTDRARFLVRTSAAARVITASLKARTASESVSPYVASGFPLDHKRTLITVRMIP